MGEESVSSWTAFIGLRFLWNGISNELEASLEIYFWRECIEKLDIDFSKKQEIAASLLFKFKIQGEIVKKNRYVLLNVW